MALKYHPDVRTNSSSTEQEKKEANDDFARINAAYAFLTGKSDDRPTDANGNAGPSRSSSGRGRTSSSSSSGYGYGYTPPHRRTGAERKSYESSNWKDYMPKYDDDEKYDAGGDSFGAIFSDLFSEVATGAAASGVGSGGDTSILNDLISFLEGNFPSVGTNSAQRTEEDIILESLLRDGGMDEIRNELDDAKLLVRQLESKEIDLETELRTISKEREERMGKKTSYMEDMGLEERRREVEARKSVVGEYLERSRLRQIKLRKRFEELRNEEASSARDNTRSSSYGSYSKSSASSNTGYGTGRSSSSRSTTSAGTNGVDDNSNQAADSSSDDDAWKRESFGSNRRRRGGSGSSARRRSRSPDESNSSSSTGQRRTTTTSSASSSSRANSSTSDFSSTYSSSSTSTGNTGRRASSYTANQSQVGASGNIPPHRRMTTTDESRYQQIQEDKRRIRDIKVDEEIDKMKKELGL